MHLINLVSHYGITGFAEPLDSEVVEGISYENWITVRNGNLVRAWKQFTHVPYHEPTALQQAMEVASVAYKNRPSPFVCARCHQAEFLVGALKDGICGNCADDLRDREREG